MGMPGHARGRYIQQDDAAFYRITSISCSGLFGIFFGKAAGRERSLA